jgi:hypothetical protein
MNYVRIFIVHIHSLRARARTHIHTHTHTLARMIRIPWLSTKFTILISYVIKKKQAVTFNDSKKSFE